VTGALVVAKAPVPGQVKTRLGAEIGMVTAAEVAAAALLDTLAACREAFGPDGCLIAMAGDLEDAVRGTEIRDLLAGWTVYPQRGDDFGARLAYALADVPGGGPVLQVGMDTPQLGAEDLHRAATALEGSDAVLGPAEDGGWWLLGLRTPTDGEALRHVPMSMPTTYDETRQALEDRGLRVATTSTMRDVDTWTDADAVARMAPGSSFAAAWGLVSA
jgi:uncharacterized protein